VVEGQLRVSEGWVRCGRCTNVFNAIDDLIDVDHGTPVALDLEQLRHGRPADEDAAAQADAHGDERAERSDRTQAGGEAAHHGPAIESGVAAPTDNLTDFSLQAPSLAPLPAPGPTVVATAAMPATPRPLVSAGEPAPVDGTPEDRAPQVLRPDVDFDVLASEALPDSRLPGQDPWTLQPADSVPPSRPPAPHGQDMPDQWLRAPSRSSGSADRKSAAPDDDHRPGSASHASVWSTSLPDERSGLPTAAAPESDPALGEPLPEAPPSFLRQADREARWRQPHMRAALAAAVVAATLALAAQAALLWRDMLAAHLPATAPALQAMCGLLGCQVQPLRRIDLVSVDSSGLIRVGDETDTTDHRYRLNLVLRSRADTPLLAPAIELSLTDPRGEVSVRRVLKATELGAPAGELPAGQEWLLRAVLATGAQRIEGYTVELFYP
jgi:hypothetical protein